MDNELELRKAFESELNPGETIYWTGTAKKPGVFRKKLNCAVTDERVIFSAGRRTKSIPYSMIEDENYVPPEVKTDEDIMNIGEFRTVCFENGSVVFRGIDSEELFRISSEGSEEAYDLVKKFCFGQNDI